MPDKAFLGHEQAFSKKREPGPFDPFFKAVWRGAATILPPLITFVIIIWIVTTINQYIFSPLTRAVR
ncbi:MAG TPA: hypothetical protein PLS55_10675, partial [Thermogutta sp.]|nr:hypothetical protein [Thermogutta sp.]